MVRGISQLFPVADPSGCPLVVPRLNDGSCYYLFILSLPFGSFAPQGSGSSKAKVTWDRTLVGDTRRWGLRVSKIRVLLPMCILKLTGSWEIGQSNGNLGQWVQVCFYGTLSKWTFIDTSKPNSFKIDGSHRKWASWSSDSKNQPSDVQTRSDIRNKLLLVAVRSWQYRRLAMCDCHWCM